MKRTGNFRLLRMVCLLLVSSAVLTTPASSQVYDLKQLTTPEIRALDRSKTAVMINIGVLEEHGPYMPCYTDGYAGQRHVKDIAEAIVERPGWAALIFPSIPLGSNPANEIGGKFHFDGSYPVRSSTLRAILMDIGTELGEGGFRWIFLIYMHGGGGGALNSHVAVEQACDYFHDTYGGHMVNLAKVMVPRDPETRKQEREKRQAIMQELLPETDLSKEQQFCPHCCGSEHSRSLYLHPHLVKPEYKNAPPVLLDGQPLRNWEDAIRVAQQDDWPGCFGSFRLGSAAEGAVRFNNQSRALADLALKILDGLDYRQFPRYSEYHTERGETAAVDRAAQQYEQELEARQEQWLREHGYE